MICHRVIEFNPEPGENVTAQRKSKKRKERTEQVAKFEAFSVDSASLAIPVKYGTSPQNSLQIIAS